MRALRHYQNGGCSTCAISLFTSHDDDDDSACVIWSRPHLRVSAMCDVCDVNEWSARIRNAGNRPWHVRTQKRRGRGEAPLMCSTNSQRLAYETGTSAMHTHTHTSTYSLYLFADDGTATTR